MASTVDGIACNYEIRFADSWRHPAGIRGRSVRMDSPGAARDGLPVANSTGLALLRLLLKRSQASAVSGGDDGTENETERELLSRVDIATVRWLLRQGLGAYVGLLLRRQELAGMVPDASHALLRRALYENAARVEFQTLEMQHVLAALQQNSIEAVLLKGAALAFTLYENPACRTKGDLDLWIDPREIGRAVPALEAIGYRLKPVEDRPAALAELVGGEIKMVGESGRKGLVELQWPPMRGEWTRHTTCIDHDAIWRRAEVEEIGGVPVRTLSPEDTLVHLCLHMAINHQFGDPWLRGLVDVHLLVTRRSLDWEFLHQNTTAWKVRTTVWTVLGLAQELLGTEVPPEFMRSIRPPSIRRWLIGCLHLDRRLLALRSAGYHLQRLVIELALVDRVQDGFGLLLFGFWPDSEWLRARYGLERTASLVRIRMMHLWNLFASGHA